MTLGILKNLPYILSLVFSHLQKLRLLKTFKITVFN